MVCLFNGEYGDHDLSKIGGIEKILQKQKEAYQSYVGIDVGDFKIISVEYDWGKRTQRVEIKCNTCGVHDYIYNGNDWRRGKGRSTRCRNCLDIAKNEKKMQKPKSEVIPYSDPSWIGKEVNGYRVLSYLGDSLFNVECVECGNRKQVRAAQFKNNTLRPCVHYKVNDYSSPDWIGKRNGNLTVISKTGSLFHCKCDCGRMVYVRGTDLFKNKTATSCKDTECPFYKKIVYDVAASKRRKDGLQYEHKAQDLFEANGYFVERTSDIGDFGVDFIARYDDDTKIAIQCKLMKSPAPVSAIQEVYAGGRYYDCTKFAVISPSGFSINALRMAAKLGVYCASERFEISELNEASQHALSLIESLPKIDNQSKEHRRETIWTIGGVSKYASEWCKEYNVSEETVRKRVKKGYSLEDALSKGRINGSTYTVNGITGSVSELANHFGIIPQTVQYRMKYRGMSIEDALFTPLEKR